MLAAIVRQLGRKAWVYEEGDRGLSVVETCLDLSANSLGTQTERIAYARGYFDAEGGVPRNPNARFYVQFVQKDYRDLREVRDILLENDIDCGRLHNPSVRVDPSYWRFYVLARSLDSFARVIGSWHPRKRPLLQTFLLLRTKASPGLRGSVVPSDGGDGHGPGRCK
ncbi:MAG: LAGLIDADG family homing endonuclease [Actinobacteria bacterium]|nr:LAGLIDADG family homing endonuclease [Actinomycetota bacterium]